MKNQKKLLSLILAGLITTSVGAASVSAAYYEHSNTSSSVYSWYLGDAGLWFKSYDDAYNYATMYGYSTGDINNPSAMLAITTSTSASSVYPYYCTQTGKYYRTYEDASLDCQNKGYSGCTVYNAYADQGNKATNISRSSAYSSSYHWYCSNTGYYYLTSNDASNDALYNFSISNPSIVDMGTTKYSSSETSTVASAAYPWYSEYTGLYYKTQSSAIAASLGYSSYVYYDYYSKAATSTYASTTYPWYSSYTRLYYKTQSDAISASNGYSSYVSYAYGVSAATSTTVSTTYPWYSSYTRLYYKTQSDAIAASNGYSSYVSYAYNNTAYPYTYTISSGTPYIEGAYNVYNYNYGYGYGYGYGSACAGWDNIVNYLDRTVIKGSTIKIEMNGATSVPSDLFQSIKGRNFCVKLIMENGATWTIDGRDVVRAKKADLTVKYNTTDIPEQLVNNCGTDGTSKVQIKAGSEGDLNMDATLAVKFSKKRSGKRVYAYHYDKGNNQLSLVASGTVQSNGYVSFANLDEGGSFLLIVK